MNMDSEMDEEAKLIEMIFRCTNCKKWFTAKNVSAYTQCPECKGSIDYIATTQFLDVAIIAKSGISEESSSQKNDALEGVVLKPVTRSKRIIHWEEWDHLLGSKPDHALAKEIGFHASAVWNRRKKLGIPVNPEAKAKRERINFETQDWPKIDPLLGTRASVCGETLLDK